MGVEAAEILLEQTQDLISVIVGSNRLDDLAARAEYLDRLHGMDEAVVGRVRDLRDQVQRMVERLRDAKDRIEAARDAIAAEEQALASARAALQSHQRQLVSARADRVAALAKIGEHEEELDGSVAAIQGKIAAQLCADRLGAAAGGPDPGRQRRPDLAGRRPGRLRLRAAHIGGSYECTRGSTSPCRKGRRSAPPPTAR